VHKKKKKLTKKAIKEEPKIKVLATSSNLSNGILFAKSVLLKTKLKRTKQTAAAI
jgi:hypothetical protein